MNKCSTTCQNSDDDTPIHIACASNNQSIVECLLEKTTSTYPFVNKSGQTYLHAACNLKAGLNIVKAIFDKGYKSLGNFPDKNGDTPLHYACRSGQTVIVEYLMSDDRCDPYRFNKAGLSPIYSALKEDNLELILHILDNKLCDLNQPVENGSSLLHCLIQTSVDKHLYHGRRYFDHLVLQDEFDNPSPHFYGLSSKFMKAFYALICSKIFDLNATNTVGNTVLHLACKFEQYETVQLLLSTDAVGQSISHRNHDNKSPIQLTRDYSIIRLLISYGANPEDVYDRFAQILRRSKEEQPLEPMVKVIMLGNSKAGKTTLVEALKSNNKDVMNVKGSTAGIETSEHNSDTFGRVSFHDFAGQPEFESSNSAFLERCSSSEQPPIFILVVDASQSEYVERRIHNWLVFIRNHCTYKTETPPHVIVIGSHGDKINGAAQFRCVYSSFVSAIENFKSSDFECFKPVLLDCRKVGTRGMRKLMLRLKESCTSLKKFIELDCRCHILIANLAKWFPAVPVVKVNDLQYRIKQHKSIKSQDPRQLSPPRRSGARILRNKSIAYDSSEVLPISLAPLLSLLKSLHIGGHILLLEGEKESWIVMKQDALFKTVNGILFAPKGFDRHLELDNNTGVVSISKVQNLFPKLDFNMVKQFLVHYEFCQLIQDNETLQLIHGNQELSDECQSLHGVYYFFPGFVQSEKPTTLWDTSEELPYSFSCGWMLQCQAKQFFETRFLHILLLRLTFAFVTASSQSSKFKRKCDIWKNGLHWGTRNGVEVLVELLEDKTVLIVLVRSF